MRVHARGSGLLVAEQAAVPRRVADQLRRLDERLELRCELDERHQSHLWRVFASQGDRPSVWIFDWREDMEDTESRPRPLSSSIVDEAASRRLGSRRTFEDPLAANDREREIDDREADEIADEAAREAIRRGKRSSPVHRSVRLRMARDKARARGENV